MIADLKDVIRSKEAAGRPKDLQVLPTLYRHQRSSRAARSIDRGDRTLSVSTKISCDMHTSSIARRTGGDPEDVIRSKEAAGWTKDVMHLPILLHTVARQCVERSRDQT